MVKRILINKRKKQKILERDNFTCCYCGVDGDFNCLEIDHIIPVVKGGTNDTNNLQTLCYKCNARKGKRTPYKKILNLNPLERLKLIKNRLNEYRNLSYGEFKAIVTQDKLFNILRIDFVDLLDLFFEISGLNKKLSCESNKNINERNILIKYIWEETDKSYRELEKLLLNIGINLSYVQIRNICVKFGDKVDEKEDLNEKKSKNTEKELKSDENSPKTAENGVN